MDMYTHSLFEPDEIRKEREVICEEIAMTCDQPSQYVQELLNTLQWKDHPLGRPITGTEEGLQKIRRKDILQYYTESYVTHNTWIVAAGNVSHSKLLRLARKYSKDIPSGKRTTWIPFAPTQEEPQILCLKKEVDQTQIALGIRSFERNHPYSCALKVINTLVGENSSSHLFQAVREDHGLAYSIGSSLGSFYDTGDLVIGAGVDENKVEKTLRLILKELKRLAARDPDCVVSVRADAGTEYGKVLAVVDACVAAGLTNASFATTAAAPAPTALPPPPDLEEAE